MTALAGIRVVELAAAPIAYAGKLLADMGADVILVEPPGGDPSRYYPPFADDEPDPERSLHFWHYHTSKRGVVCNLDDPRDRDRLLRLLDTADVLLEAEVPGRLQDLGMDFDVLSRTNPGLVHVAVSPYGKREAASQLPATDLTLMAAGGPPWSCGYDDHGLPPVRGWGEQAFHTASHFAVMSALTALLYRGAGGAGQFVDVSITAALNVTTEAASYTWLVNGGTVQRQTGRHAAIRATGETQMRCADGRWVNTGVPPRFPAEFGRLLGWLTELGLKDDFPEAVFLEMGANWEGQFDLSQIGKDETITAVFASGREALQLIASRIGAYDFFIGCQEAGLAVGVIYAPEEAFEDPNFVARGYPTTVRHDDLDRTVRYPGAPYRFNRTPWAISRRAPQLGEHTDEIFGAW